MKIPTFQGTFVQFRGEKTLSKTLVVWDFNFSTSRLFHTCRIDNSGELLESFLESFHEAVQGEVVWCDF